MNIRIDGRTVSVLEEACRYRTCLYVGHYTHHSPGAGASGRFAWTDEHLSCVCRDGQGCPPEGERVISPERAHPDCPRPRFTQRLYKGGLGRVRCATCARLVPRWAAMAQQQAAEARP